jgi:diadenosine tetraphosphatase ApaH/serine/threonine PP2A family protein phosphatase
VYAAAPDCDLLLFGHTHKPWVREYGGILFVNCSSVGKPKDGDPRGSFTVLAASNGCVSVSIERAEYDARRGSRDPERGASAGARRTTRAGLLGPALREQADQVVCETDFELREVSWRCSISQSAIHDL